MRIILILFTLLFLTAGVPGGMAAEIGVRVGDRGSAVRIVLEGPKGAAQAGTVRVIDGRTVEVAFPLAADMPKFVPDSAIPEIADIRRVSEPGTPLKVLISLADSLYSRDLAAGNRVIIDLKQSASLRAASARAAAAAVAAAPKKPVGESKMDEAKAPVAAAAPVPAVEQAPVRTPSFIIDPVDPPILTLASTAAFGVAAFVAHGNLIVVIDDPNYIGTPRLAGKNVDQLAPLDRRTTSDATVFTLPLPEGVSDVRGEGGDLLWRIVLAKPKPGAKPIKVERVEGDKSSSVVLSMKEVTRIVSIDDPKTGETYRVVTVRKSTEYSGPSRRFSEFLMPFSPVGVAIVSRVDDLNVTTGEDGVVIARPGGLSITAALEAMRYEAAEPLGAPPAAPKETPEGHEPALNVGAMKAQFVTEQGNGLPLFRFDRWAMGGESSLLSNENALVADMAEKKAEDRASGLMNIGKMYLANGRGAEAGGYFRLALESQPGLAEMPEFIALRGAAYAVNAQFDLAYSDLRSPLIDSYPDVNVWRAYVLANLQDWQQASTRLGGDVSWIRQYPSVIAYPMILSAAEIALRDGNTKLAASILGTINSVLNEPVQKGKAASPLMVPVLAQYDYLQGEIARQQGKKETARDLWQKLAKGADDKYRARARLALTVLDYEEGKIKPEKAVDMLETLRYAWRGDEVEAAINARLGEVYLDHGQYLRGLNALKEAASMADNTEMGRRITASMTDSFRSLFIGDKVKKIDPLDAITVYEKFSELVPIGPEANRLTLNLVDRLMEVDLLDRAAKVLEDMVDHRLEGEQRVEVALRLAATYLLNHQHQSALNTLNRASEMFATVSNPEKIVKLKRELSLLRARAQFQSGRVDSALSTLSALPDDPDVLRARTDIAWQTGRWSEAATSLEKMLALSPIPENKPPTPEQAELVRNLAVATNLSGDRSGVAQLRRKYDQAMMQTDLAQEFDVITRERQTPTLADRDTMNKLVSEVDMFGSFLNAYRQTAKAEEKTSDNRAPEEKVAGPAVAGEAEKETAKTAAGPLDSVTESTEKAPDPAPAPAAEVQPGTVEAD